MRKAVGIIPAAGQGTRLRPFRYPKELFPIGYVHNGNGDGDVQLKVVCQYVMDCLVEASVSQAYVVVSDHKFEILRFLSDGQEYGINLAYLYQREVNGLPFAIDCAYDWIKDQVSVLVLPDTILEPIDSARQALEFFYEKRADVVLGVFPTNHPEDLCAVEYDSAMRVLKLRDKERGHPIMNTWGMAVLSPKFSEFLHGYLQRAGASRDREMPLAECFSKALEAGLNVLALQIAGGRFWDIGKNSSLIKARREFERYSL
jgi:glucose-1-phosphate thymidylyltransferase